MVSPLFSHVLFSTHWILFRLDCNLKQLSPGEYAGFDEDEPTSRQGGKGEVIKMLKKTHRYNSIVLIGDGATDLEACPPADAFIGEYCTSEIPNITFF